MSKQKPFPRNSDSTDEAYLAGSLPDVFQWIEAVSKQLKRMQSETLRATGLTPPQYFLLDLLWEQDRRPFKELAERLNSSRATITEIVDALDAAFYMAFQAVEPTGKNFAGTRISSGTVTTGDMVSRAATTSSREVSFMLGQMRAGEAWMNSLSGFSFRRR